MNYVMSSQYHYQFYSIGMTNVIILQTVTITQQFIAKTYRSSLLRRGKFRIKAVSDASRGVACRICHWCHWPRQLWCPL